MLLKIVKTRSSQIPNMQVSNFPKKFGNLQILLTKINQIQLLFSALGRFFAEALESGNSFTAFAREIVSNIQIFSVNFCSKFTSLIKGVVLALNFR